MNQAATVETVATEPEVLPEIVEAIEPHRQELELLRERAKGLQVVDDITEQAALLFISTCKDGFNTMENGRKAIVKPHNDYVDKVNAAHTPYTTLYKELGKEVDSRVSAYTTRKQQLIDEANRRELARVEEEKRKKAEQEKAARDEAERLRKEADRLEQEELDRQLQVERDRLAAEKRIKDEEEAVREAKRKGDQAAAKAAQEALDKKKREEEERVEKAEQDRLAAVQAQSDLEKKAIQQESKADIVASKASMVTPDIKVNESLGVRILDNGAKVGSRKTVDWHFANGIPKDGDYYQDDPRVKSIPARYFVLDLSKLGKDVKNGVPIEGTLRTEGTMTTAGRK